MSMADFATPIGTIPDSEPPARAHHRFACCSDRGWPVRCVSRLPANLFVAQTHFRPRRLPATACLQEPQAERKPGVAEVGCRQLLRGETAIPLSGRWAGVSDGERPARFQFPANSI